MPCARGLAIQRMPKEFKGVASVIFGKMNPGIGKLLRNVTLVKCPRLSCYRTQQTEISSSLATDTGFLKQLTHSSHFG
ncbi:hypothetical protein OA77_15565 [Pseudomonas coronafaciens]|nr:hypothetical protein OA77_15565 [Pseudomonas coronafaciens]